MTEWSAITETQQVRDSVYLWTLFFKDPTFDSNFLDPDCFPDDFSISGFRGNALTSAYDDSGPYSVSDSDLDFIYDLCSEPFIDFC